MTVMTHAMPYLLAGIALYALTASLFYQELLGQLKALRVRSRRTSGRSFLRQLIQRQGWPIDGMSTR